MFGVPRGEYCAKYDYNALTDKDWNYDSNAKVDSNGDISCITFADICKDRDHDCFNEDHYTSDGKVNFSDLDKFEDICLEECEEYTWVHGSLIFNTFVFAQIFNEYNSKSIHSDWDVFSDIPTNPIFMAVTVITIALQIMLIEVGGEFIRTSPLTLNQWLITIALGAISLPVAAAARFIPVEEDPDMFFDNSGAPHSLGAAGEKHLGHVQLTANTDGSEEKHSLTQKSV